MDNKEIQDFAGETNNRLAGIEEAIALQIFEGGEVWEGLSQTNVWTSTDTNTQLMFKDILERLSDIEEFINKGSGG